VVETPCLDNSHEPMCELQPRAAALQDSLVCTAAQERSISALRTSMVRGLVSRTMASLHCQVVMTASIPPVSHRKYPTGIFNSADR